MKAHGVPALIRHLRGEITRSDIKRRITGIKMIDDMAMMETVWYAKQLERIAKGEEAT
mgnify:CR=1 FL=1